LTSETKGAAHVAVRIKEAADALTAHVARIVEGEKEQRLAISLIAMRLLVISAVPKNVETLVKHLLANYSALIAPEILS